MLAADTLPVLIGGAAAKSVQFTDVNGTKATVQVGGAGNATVTFSGTSLSPAAGPNGIVVQGTGVSLDSISITGTTLNTVLQITTRGRTLVQVGSITSASVLSAINAPGASLTGDLTTGGWVHRVSLGAAQNGTISIGPSHSNGGLLMNLGSATDESLVSDIRIDALVTGAWVNSATTPQSIAAPQIMSVTCRGNFGPDLTVTGVPGAATTFGTFNAGAIVGGNWNIAGNAQTVRAGSIAPGWAANVGGGITGLNVAHDATIDLTALTAGNILVRGTLSDSTITLNQPLAPVGFDLNGLTVGGGIVSSTVRSIGSINTISARFMQDSQVYAGVMTLPAGQSLPQAGTDFANVAKINALTLRRTAGVPSYSGSDVAAYSMGNVILGTVAMSNSGTQFGLGAHALRSITLTDLATGKNVHELNVPSTQQFSSLLVSKGIDPKDFSVNVV